jgi:hypothetical protein
MKVSLKTGISAFALLASLGSTAFAGGGAFDFLDPCIKAKDQFAEQRQTIASKFDSAQHSVESAVAPGEFRDIWMKSKRKDLRPLFDSDVAPTLSKMGVTDMEKGFNTWFEITLAQIEPQQFTELINRNYRELVKEELAKTRSATSAEFDKAKSELDQSCKTDVANQALRVALAPIGWVKGNFEAGKNEKNVITQVIRAVTGISPEAIAKQGLLGGDNSEARKAANAIAGGPSSEVRKALRALDPGNWRF